MTPNSNIGISNMQTNGLDGIKFSNISATPANFNLRGGRYSIEVLASAWGTANIRRLAADGSTFVTCNVSQYVANGIDFLDLPTGTYQLTLSGVTAFYADIVSMS